MIGPFGSLRRLGAMGSGISGRVNSSPTVAGVKIIQGRADNTLTRLAQGVVALLIAVGCIVLFVPFAPALPTAALDSGWAFGLNAAVDKGLVFGKDVIFTFGPYASAYSQQYHPATDTRMLWSSGVLALAFAASLTILARDRYKLSVLLTFPLIVLFRVLPDPLFFCNPLVFIVLVCRIAMPETHPANLRATGPVRAALALLVLALSLLPLIKGTFAATSFIVGGLGWCLLMLRGQRRLAMSGVLLFTFGLLGFWVLAGQRLTQLPAFFAALGQIISGYSDAMSSRGSVSEPIIYIVACCLLGVIHFRLFRSSGLSGFVLAGGVALLLFMAFKAGFVRHDGHAMIAAGVLGLAGWVITIGFPGRRAILGLAVCLTGWAAIDHPYTGLSVWTLRDRIVQPFVDSAGGLFARVEEPGALRKRYDESLSTIRAQQPLPPLTGTTDVYSYGQSILLAHGLEWAPRPVLQSYSAYTPLLLEMDAAHLTGAAAPDNILFSVQPIDSRLPSLEDGLSWPSLLSRYEPVSLIGDMAILQRRQEPTSGAVVREPAIVTRAYSLGEEISLPTNERALWAKIKMKPTLLGKVVDKLYKLPELQIEFRMSDGSFRRFRYIAGMGETGFVVSPLVENADDFLALEFPGGIANALIANDRPQSMSVSVDGGKVARRLWKDKLSVQLFTMDIPPQRRAASLFFSSNPTMDAVSVDAAKLPETNDCSIDRFNNRAADRPPTTISGVLRVEGWAAMSIKEGAAPERTTITLMGSKGDARSINARIIARDDVNQYFNRPQMGHVGYIASADISKLDGDYTLEIEISAKGKTQVCARRIALSIVPVDWERQ